MAAPATAPGVAAAGAGPPAPARQGPLPPLPVRRPARSRRSTGSRSPSGAGEFVSLVGPSGCGKTTLLRIAAGLLAPRPGPGEARPAVELFGASPSEARRARWLGLVAQEPGLLPWLTVERNVGLVADLAGVRADVPAPARARRDCRVRPSPSSRALRRHAAARGARAPPSPTSRACC